MVGYRFAMAIELLFILEVSLVVLLNVTLNIIFGYEKALL